MNKITKEDLYKFTKNGYLTVGDLKRFIQKYNIPDHAPVLVERVEDKYYEGIDVSGISGYNESEDGRFPEGSKSEGWGVYLKEGDSYRYTQTMNARMREEISRRKNGEHEKYPEIKDPSEYIVELDDSLKNQYHPVWGPVFYSNDPDVLFLDLHY